MILTQTTLMYGEINEFRITVSSNDSSLLIFFSFKFCVFGSSHPEVLLREGVLEMKLQSQ